VSPIQRPIRSMLAYSANLLFSTQEIGFIHREVNLYIAQKICLGYSDGKMFECGKFLKHSLQQGYIAGLGRDLGKALVNDTPRRQLLQANII
jgi:hypothetical protein